MEHPYHKTLDMSLWGNPHPVTPFNINQAIVIQDDFNCGDCQRYAVDPVKICSNGHVFCGFCNAYLQNHCLRGDCNGDIIPDQISDQYSRHYARHLPCRYEESGCKKIIPPSEMMSHVFEGCGYRPIKCYHPLCNDNPTKPAMSFMNLTAHLLGCKWHGVFNIINLATIPPNNLPNHPTTMGLFARLNHYIFPTPQEFSILIMNYDNQVFLLNRQMISDRMFVWMSVLGDDTIAQNYQWRLRFTDQDAVTWRPHDPWYYVSHRSTTIHCTLAIVPAHKIDFFNLSSMSTKCIHYMEVAPYCKPIVGTRANIVFTHTWKDFIEIFKVVYSLPSTSISAPVQAPS